MEEKIRLRISVRSLVEFLLRAGDIDNRRGGAGEREALLEGSRLHRKLQRQMGESYQAEVSLSCEVNWEEALLVVEGRADGIFSDENLVYIDEIKSMYRDVTAFEEPVPVHLAQAKCYAYMVGTQRNLEEIGVQMTYCNLESGDVKRFRSKFGMEELREWFRDLTDQYRKWADLQIDWKGTRQASISDLEFPYDWRPGQKETASAVYRSIVREKQLFIQAPTGTGKTLSVLYPAVKAVGEGHADRIFYATAKTVTRRVAEEAFGILRDHGLRMKTVTLTSREHICFMCSGEYGAPEEKPVCNPEACPFAKGHYDRVNDAVYELVLNGEVFDRKAIEAQAGKWQVCPYEMSLDIAFFSDAVICDYNYIFDPNAKLKRFFGEGAKGEYLFLIDEAHNLVDRGREMFSASLYKEDFLKLRREVRPYSKKITNALNRCNGWLLDKKRECERVKVLKTETGEDNLGEFSVYLMELLGEMEDFLDNSGNSERNEKVLDLYFQVQRFLSVCSRLNENYVVYTELCPDGRFLLRLFCVDLSKNLQECLDRGKSTVFFSATLLPIQYYRRLLSARSDDYAVYAQPVFDPVNRLVLIGKDVTSRYADRSPKEYRKMAEYVLETVLAKRGNYMVFFSSYQMMDDVADQFADLLSEREETVGMIRQSAGMRERERDEFLARFDETHPQGFTGFCVMGGIFGEGIDLKEDRLIGVIVIGTGIPQICVERELLKDFYDRRKEDGFFYSYLCPGMNRVLQSAGRLIRTETDKGVILLLDERFDEPRYRNMFPREWEQPKTCRITDVRKEMEAFWTK